MCKEIIIRNRVIGIDHPLFIVAECGVTCNYDMEMTKNLIDVVRNSGADAIKLIFWFPEEIMSDRSVDYTYETASGPMIENMYEMLNKLRFTLEEWREVKAYADAKDVILFSTVSSPSGIHYAEELGLDAYKLSSWDYNYLTLFRRIARLGKPMLLDTGPVNLLDVSKVINLIRECGNQQIVLMHCFHTQDHEEMNMRSIPYMQQTFNTLTGNSSPDRDDTMDVVAVSLGAVVLEKRLTLDRNFPGHHHFISKEPKEFEDYVRLMKNVKASLGDYDLRPSTRDLQERKKWFRHLVANMDISKGTKLSARMLEGKRGEFGVSPEHVDFFIGRTIKRDLKENESLSWDDV